MIPAADSAVPAEAVGPLIRGLAVLRRLALADGRLPAGEAARATGLARSTVDRVVSTLTRVGYLRTEGRDVCLTPRLMELGNAYLAACRLPDRLGPLADALAGRLDESVSLSVPDRDGVRFVHQAAPRRALSPAFRIGDLLPAERGAPGALFAAGWSAQEWRCWRRRRAADPLGTGFPALPGGAREAGGSFEERAAAAARHGWSADDQLIERGLVAVAVPVRDPAGRPVCAVAVASHTSRHGARSLRLAALDELRDTAAAMERTLAEAGPAAERPGHPDDPPAVLARASKRELGPEFVESLARGLAVLAALDSGAGRPLTAVAEATGLARASARRSLITLEHLGYVDCDGRFFRPTPRVLDLGFALLSNLTLPQIAQPHLAALVEQVRDSASMAVLAGDDIHYVARVPTVRIMSVNITVGTRFPAYATAMGRVLLAGLPAGRRTERLESTALEPLTRRTVTSVARLAEVLADVERDGFALVDEELEEGLRSIAVPVRDRLGRVVAAVNVSTHAGRSTAAATRRDLLPPLRAAAAGIERDLHAADRFARVLPD